MRVLRKGDWVVCHSSFREPSTWAKVTDVTPGTVWVSYRGPIWSSNAWAPAYVTRYPTLKAARKVVEDYRDSQRSSRP